MFAPRAQSAAALALAGMEPRTVTAHARVAVVGIAGVFFFFLAFMAFMAFMMALMRIRRQRPSSPMPRRASRPRRRAIHCVVRLRHARRIRRAEPYVAQRGIGRVGDGTDRVIHVVRHVVIPGAAFVGPPFVDVAERT